MQAWLGRYIRPMKLALFAILALSACAPAAYDIDPTKVVDAPAHASEAIAIAAAHYGLTNVPPVTWYGKGLDCGDGYGWTYEGNCLGGISWDWHVVVAIGHDFAYERTSLCHEFAHLWLLVTTGDGNAEHDDEAFQPAGEAERCDDDLEVANIPTT